MASFSLSDRVYAALGSCLSCFGTHTQNDTDPRSTPTSSDHRVRAHSDELEGLLADVADTDAEADAISLHSNIGEGRQRHKGPRTMKRISIFGWNLFGKPAIQLGDGESQDDLLSSQTRRRVARGLMSSATLDSDAAPLESSAIDALSSAQAQERAHVAEEEERRLKAERRQRKEARKVIKRASRALSQGETEGEFEGFQGSGDTYPGPRSPASASDSRDSRDGAYGPFVEASRTDDLDADDADLDGELYTRRAVSSGNSNGSADSRSRTSGSHSQDNPTRYNHHYISQQPQPHLVPLPSRSEASSLPLSSDPPRRKKRSSKSKSASSTSNSQSSSLPSPTNTLSPMAPSPDITLPSSPLPTSHHEERPKTIPYEYPVDKAFPSPGLGGAFPSPGIGHPGFGGLRRHNRDMGAFLATRGES